MPCRWNDEKQKLIFELLLGGCPAPSPGRAAQRLGETFPPHSAGGVATMTSPQFSECVLTRNETFNFILRSVNFFPIRHTLTPLDARFRDLTHGGGFPSFMYPTPLRMKLNQTIKWTLGSIALLFALETHALAKSAPTTAVSPTPDKKDEDVELSPFVIKPDEGWVANTSLVGNRTNKEIMDLPITVDALTRDFLNDTRSMTLEDAAKFVAGMTVVNILDGRPNDEDRLTYRGLANSVGGATSTQSSRNFFVWYAPTDNYNVERIDFNKGSNSLMFGAASPGGLAAVYTKRAEFRNFNESDLQFGSYNSYRMMLDFNRQITDKLAARFNYVYRSDNTYVDNTDYKFQAMDLAVTYRPFKNTEIRLEGEKGFEKRPRGTNRVNVLQLSAPGLGYGNPTATNRWYYTSDGNIVNTTPNFTSLYANPSARDTVNPSGAPLSVLQGIPQTILLQTTSDPTSKVLIPTGATATFPGRPRNESLVGKTDDISRPYGNVAVWVTQTMGKLVLELAYDNQRQHGRRNDSVITLGMTAAARPYFDKVIT